MSGEVKGTGVAKGTDALPVVFLMDCFDQTERCKEQYNKCVCTCHPALLNRNITWYLL